MRAIMSLVVNLERDELKTWLTKHSWLPNIAQDDEEAKKHKEEIIASLPNEKQDYARRTCEFIIVHGSTDSWGMVSRLAKNTITIRLKNTVPAKLKRACERFVECVHTTASEDFYFESNEIEVLEPSQDLHAFHGRILPAKCDRWTLAKRERADEYFVFKAGMSSACILLALTSPPVKNMMIEMWKHNTQWLNWSFGILERLATTVFVSGAFSYMAVRMRWLRLKRYRVVIWSLSPLFRSE